MPSVTVRALLQRGHWSFFALTPRVRRASCSPWTPILGPCWPPRRHMGNSRRQHPATDSTSGNRGSLLDGIPCSLPAACPGSQPCAHSSGTRHRPQTLLPTTEHSSHASTHSGQCIASGRHPENKEIPFLFKEYYVKESFPWYLFYLSQDNFNNLIKIL